MAVMLFEEITSEISFADLIIAQAKSKPSKAVEEEEDDDDDDVDVDGEDAEDEEWDPDFEEFDLPKSKVKKTGTTGTGAGKKAGKSIVDNLSPAESADKRRIQPLCPSANKSWFCPEICYFCGVN